MLHFRHSPYDLVIPCLILLTVRVSGSGLDPRRTGHSGLLQDATWMISGGGSVVVVAVVSWSKRGVLTNTVEVGIVFNTEIIKVSTKTVKISSNFLRTGYYFLSPEPLRLRQ